MILFALLLNSVWTKKSIWNTTLSSWVRWRMKVIQGLLTYNLYYPNFYNGFLRVWILWSPVQWVTFHKLCLTWTRTLILHYQIVMDPLPQIEGRFPRTFFFYVFFFILALSGFQTDHCSKELNSRINKCIFWIHFRDYHSTISLWKTQKKHEVWFISLCPQSPMK